MPDELFVGLMPIYGKTKFQEQRVINDYSLKTGEVWCKLL